MRLSEIQPFLRYAGHLTVDVIGKFIRFLAACDHRLFVCERGEAVFFAADKEYTMQAGSVLFIRAGTVYRYLSLSDDFSMFSFNFDLTQRHSDEKIPIPPDNAEHPRRRAVLEGDEDFPGEELATVLYTVDAEAPAFAARIEREYRHAALYHEMRTSHLLADLLALSVRGALRRGMPKSASLVSSLTGYIRAHYSENCDNSTLSTVFSYHPNYLNRLMVEHTGMSLHQYVNRTRIGHALTLLESGAYSVTEVGIMVGFSDLSHFSKTFRKIVGFSPTRYSMQKEGETEE